MVQFLIEKLKFVPLLVVHELLLLRLRVETWLDTRGQSSPPPRVVATACWTFPIYSQTFAHQEMVALARGGFSLRLLYSQLGPRDELAASCSDLWPLKRRILLHATTGAWDRARFRRRNAAKVAQLTQLIAKAAGMQPQELERHDHFLHAFSFARAVEACKPDYLHSYFFYERTLFALVASHLLDVPRGVSCYADHMLQDYPLKVVPLHLSTCDVIVATSRLIRTELEALHGGPLETALVKPNAIDTSNFPVTQRRRTAGEPLRLLCVSRIDPKKGLEYLIDAVGLLRGRGIEVNVDIFGTAAADVPQSVEYEDALHQRVGRLGLQDAVRFSGRRDSRDVQLALEATDIFVAPFVELPNGDKDGIPTAVLEAMAAGCAIITTNAGSVSEVIDDGREGLIVPQRDAAALAGAIEKLAADEPLVTALRSAASVRARRQFDVASSEVPFHSSIRRAIDARQTASATMGARR